MKKRTTITAIILVLAMVFTSCGGGGDTGEVKQYTASVIKSIIAENVNTMGVALNSPFKVTTSKDISEKELKNMLVVEPEIDFEVKKEDNKRYLLSMNEHLKDGTVYQIAAKTDIEQENIYSWAFQTISNMQVTGTFPRNEATDVPINSGIEMTFNGIPNKDIGQYFEITPKVDGKFEFYEKKAIFMPSNFDKNMVYDVTVKQGFGFEDTDEVTREDYSFSFKTRTTSYYDKYYFSFYDSMYSFDTETIPYFAGMANLPKDLDEDSIKVYQYDNEEQFVETLKKSEQKYAWPYMSKIDQEGLNEAQLTYLDAYSKGGTVDEEGSDYLVFDEKLPQGYYLVTFEIDGIKNHAFFQVSDIYAYLISDLNKKVVWVHNGVTKEPMANAKVEIDGNKESLTDAEGIAMIADPIDLENIQYGYIRIYEQGKRTPYIIQVSNRDVGYMVYYDSPKGFFEETQHLVKDNYWTYLHLDRYRYLPTDTIHVFGVAVDKKNRTPVENVNVKLVALDYVKGLAVENIIQEKVLDLSADGSYTTTFDLEDKEIGSYKVKVYTEETMLEQSYLSVSQFEKPKYVVDLSIDKERMFLEELATAKVKATFYEGTPVNNMTFDYEYYVRYDNKQIGILNTDSNGIAELTLKANFQKNEWQPENLRLRLSNNEADEVNLEQYDHVLVFPKKTMVEIETEKNGDQGEIQVLTNLIDIEADDYKGKAINKDITAVIKEIYYEKRVVGQYYDYINKIVKKRYEYDKRQNIIDQFDAKTIDGVYGFTLDMEADKNYEISVNITDVDGSVIIQKRNITNYNGAYRDYESYQLKKDVVEDDYDYNYKIGEEVKLKLINQKEEDVIGGKTLFFNIKKEIDSYDIMATNKYAYTFERRHIPNNFIKAVYFDGNTYKYVYGIWSGYDYEEEEIKIGIESDEKEYRPGEEATVKVNAEDVNGEPVVADLNILIIDKRMYDIAGNQPNILMDLYRWVYDDRIINERIPEVDNFLNGSGAEKGGDGEGFIENVRKEFKNIAYFETITLDKEGNGEITFKVPDDVTSWLVICQGVTMDMKAGSSTKELYATMPMFVDVIFKDNFMTGDKTSVALRAFGDKINLDENVKYAVQIEKVGDTNSKTYSGEGKSFELTNVSIGSLTKGNYLLTAQASQGDYQDAIKIPFEVADQFLKIERNDVYKVKKEMEIVSVEGNHRIIIYNKLISQYKDLAFDLLSQSYGNRVDQVIAKEFVLEHFSEIFGFTYKDQSQSSHLRQYQVNDGGVAILSYDTPSLELSARMASFAKEYFNEEAMKSYFRENIAQEKISSTELIYGLWGLAELGEPVLLDLEYYENNKENLSAEEIVVLGNGYAAVGSKVKAKEMYDFAREEYSKSTRQYIYMANKSTEQGLKETGLMTILAAKLNLEEKDKLLEYISNKNSDKQLLNLDMLMYLNETAVKNLNSKVISSINSNAILKYGNQTEKIDITNQEFFTTILTKLEIDSLKFERISGELEMMVVYDGPTDGIEETNQFNFEITYEEDSVKQSDEMTIHIAPSFGSNAFSGGYEITVPIPAGYIFQEKIISNDEVGWYGYTDDLKNYHIVFYYNSLTKKYPRNIKYTMRAVLPGEYNTDNSVMINSDRSFKYEVKGQQVTIIE